MSLREWIIEHFGKNQETLIMNENLHVVTVIDLAITELINSFLEMYKPAESVSDWMKYDQQLPVKYVNAAVAAVGAAFLHEKPIKMTLLHHHHH